MDYPTAFIAHLQYCIHHATRMGWHFEIIPVRTPGGVRIAGFIAAIRHADDELSCVQSNLCVRTEDSVANLATLLVKLDCVDPHLPTA